MQYPCYPSSAQGAVQNQTITASSATLTNPFGSQTRQVLVGATVLCYVVIGPGTPTVSTSTGTLIQPSVFYCFKCSPGETLAVIGTSGTISCTELS